MTTVDHTRDISISIALAALPAVLSGFNQLILLDEATGNDLGGARTKAYTDTTETAADVTASNLSAAGAAQINAALAQRPRPAKVYAGRVDTGAGTPETYSDGLAAVRTDIGDDFFVISMDSRTAAVQVALATTVESTDFFLALQSADADWLTSGVPSGYSTIAAYEQCAVVYHDTGTVYTDSAWMSKWMAADPDVKCSPGAVPLKGVSDLATGLSETQIGHLQTNDGNVALAQGPEPHFVSRAVNMAGRPVHEILTATWFERRLKTDIATAVAAYGNRNEKWEVTRAGAAHLKAIIESRCDIGRRARHFSDYEVTVYAPTQADVDAARLRAQVRLVAPNHALTFSITGYTSRTEFADA